MSEYPIGHVIALWFMIGVIMFALMEIKERLEKLEGLAASVEIAACQYK